jgi:hypothetical protein
VASKREGPQRERERSPARARRAQRGRSEQDAVAAVSVRRCGDDLRRRREAHGGHSRWWSGGEGAWRGLISSSSPLRREIGIVFCGDDSMRTRILMWEPVVCLSPTPRAFS